MRASISQTFNLGLAKITVSKSGLSVSTGIPGVRIGINSKGRANVRLGIPGTGLNWIKSKKVI